MGGIIRMRNLERFMRSPEGQAAMDKYKTELMGRRITAVAYETGCDQIGMVLSLDNGDVLTVTPPEFDYGAIEEEYANVLEREYYVDYPEQAQKPAIRVADGQVPHFAPGNGLAPRYGWAWEDGEDEDAGKSWITIGPLDEDGTISDEMAVIMVRDAENVRRKNPDWIKSKERHAQQIVDALNLLQDGAPPAVERMDS